MLDKDLYSWSARIAPSLSSSLFQASNLGLNYTTAIPGSPALRLQTTGGLCFSKHTSQLLSSILLHSCSHLFDSTSLLQWQSCLIILWESLLYRSYRHRILSTKSSSKSVVIQVRSRNFLLLYSKEFSNFIYLLFLDFRNLGV